MSPCDKYGNVGYGCLWSQHMKIIKLPNSNFSSAFYNYAWPKEKKKIWNTGRGVWCHMAAQTQLPKHFKNKQGTFLFPLSNHMWAQHVRSSLQVDSDRLFVFWLLVCFLGDDLQWGPCSIRTNITEVVELFWKWKNFLKKKDVLYKNHYPQQEASLPLAWNCSGNCLEKTIGKETYFYPNEI